VRGLLTVSHGERFFRRGLFPDKTRTHDELEDKFVVATSMSTDAAQKRWLSNTGDHL
jgi:hypothetical protein